MLTFFIALALICRLAFWLYTHRVWEDSLITLTAARNVWEGIGLTHHASEPRVHSFTSPLSVLIPLLPERFNAGLLALRLASLTAAIATIYLAHRIALRLSFHWSAQILVLTYLACDQLQIFFGMAGMETQVVTAIALAAPYFYMQRSWQSLGWTCGLATIARPEFILFLLPPIGIALVLYHRQAIIKVATRSLVIAAPWYVFATLYYGSPVPNTILAKSPVVRGMSWQEVARYALHSWRDFAPFKEFCAAVNAPVPDLLLLVIVLTVAALFLCGVVFSFRHKNVLLIASAAVIGFVLYRTVVVRNSYYMWYMPPFLALGFGVAGYGLHQISVRWPRVAGAVAIALALAYASHIPFSLPLEKKVQEGIEVDVRERIGHIIAAMTKPSDTIVLEPLGVIGRLALNRTIYDFPGLGSKVARRAVKNVELPSPAGLINSLQPTYAVVRPGEYLALLREFPQTAANYEFVVRLRAEPTLKLENMGYCYHNGDREFGILRRTRMFGAVVRP